MGGWLIIRLRRMHEMQAGATDVLIASVSLSIMRLRSAKTDVQGPVA